MGYICHHAIIVTGEYGDWLDMAHKKAGEIFPKLGEISGYAMNGTRSFFIPPDGSKENWEESNMGDRRRDRFIDWLSGNLHADGSHPLSWVEVQYGDDDWKTKICRDSDESRREGKCPEM